MVGLGVMLASYFDVVVGEPSVGRSGVREGRIASLSERLCVRLAVAKASGKTASPLVVGPERGGLATHLCSFRHPFLPHH